MNEWRLIDTAPKDGTKIFAGSTDGSFYICFWNGRSWDDGDYFDHIDGITHWMPLPEPPK